MRDQPVLDLGPRPWSQKVNPDCDFRYKFEQIPSQWNGVTGRSRILSETLSPTGTDFSENEPHLFFGALKKAHVKTPYVIYLLCNFKVTIYIIEFSAIFSVPFVWKHMAEAPMFPNIKSIDLRVKCYSDKFQKHHGESMLFPLQENFVCFSLR